MFYRSLDETTYITKHRTNSATLVHNSATTFLMRQSSLVVAFSSQSILLYCLSGYRLGGESLLSYLEKMVNFHQFQINFGYESCYLYKVVTEVSSFLLQNRYSIREGVVRQRGKRLNFFGSDPCSLLMYLASSLPLYPDRPELFSSISCDDAVSSTDSMFVLQVLHMV